MAQEHESGKIDIEKILYQVKSALKSLYGERFVDMILYGSYARGDQEPGSDIDIAIVIDGSIDKYEEVDKIVDVTNDISLENEVLISVLPLTLAEYETGRYQIFNNIRREGMVV